MNWQWHEPSQTLWPSIHSPFYASSGEPAKTTTSLQENACHLLEQLYWEEMYHRQRLIYQAINAIINRVDPKVKAWLEGGPKPTMRVAVSPSDKPRTQGNSRILQEIASSSSRL